MTFVFAFVFAFKRAFTKAFFALFAKKALRAALAVCRFSPFEKRQTAPCHQGHKKQPDQSDEQLKMELRARCAFFAKDAKKAFVKARQRQKSTEKIKRKGQNPGR
ncbi:MAG: hypothetical protein HQL99_10245 [Magnetococcales bacterium]|nr:hypothetical protein [Magnetococcales bacterium]